MPEGVEVRIDVAGFVRQMKTFTAKVEKRIARKAVSAGAGVFRQIAKQMAPVATKLNRGRAFRPGGTLMRNIILLGRKGTRDKITYSVLVRTAKRVKAGTKRTAFKAAGDPFYWYFLERGWRPTGPHGQTGRNARRVARSRSRGNTYRLPFLQPAFNAGKGLALQKVLQTMDEEIAKENTLVG